MNERLTIEQAIEIVRNGITDYPRTKHNMEMIKEASYQLAKQLNRRYE